MLKSHFFKIMLTLTPFKCPYAACLYLSLHLFLASSLLFPAHPPPATHTHHQVSLLSDPPLPICPLQDLTLILSARLLSLLPPHYHLIFLSHFQPQQATSVSSRTLTHQASCLWLLHSCMECSLQQTCSRILQDRLTITTFKKLSLIPGLGAHSSPTAALN